LGVGALMWLGSIRLQDTAADLPVLLEEALESARES
jgi:hypothetical protein